MFLHCWRLSYNITYPALMYDVHTEYKCVTVCVIRIYIIWKTRFFCYFMLYKYCKYYYNCISMRFHEISIWWVLWKLFEFLSFTSWVMRMIVVFVHDASDMEFMLKRLSECYHNWGLTINVQNRIHGKSQVSRS